MLGHIYYWGDGVEKDKDQSIKWYQKAAAQGDTMAVEQLNELFDNGEKVYE